MPSLTNTRWELFATGLAQGKTKKQAYIDAGYSITVANDGNASVLSNRPEILSRVAELIKDRAEFRNNYVDHTDMEHMGALEKAAEEGNVTRSWIITQLMENAKLAREVGQFAAANQALKLLGTEIGMFVERKSPPEPADDQKALATPTVTVENINKLLENIGYKGPPIDLTTAEKPNADSK